MNTQELTKAVNASMRGQLAARGYAASVDVLMDIGILSKADYESWRFGKIPYLEKVCKANLHKLSAMARPMRLYAQANKCKASFTFYRQWGCKTTRKLRFSKSGNPAVEEGCATHYVLPTFSKKE